jgi:hypothetical protein
VHLNGYATMGELMLGLARYFAFYNKGRSHQSLDNQTPDEVYKTGPNPHSATRKLDSNFMLLMHRGLNV